MVEVDAEVAPRDGIVDVRILKYDVGALAAQLQRYLLQVATRRSLHDGPADNG